jgi:hypothetical protein
MQMSKYSDKTFSVKIIYRQRKTVGVGSYLKDISTLT